MEVSMLKAGRQAASEYNIGRISKKWGLILRHVLAWFYAAPIVRLLWKLQGNSMSNKRRENVCQLCDCLEISQLC